MKLSRGRRCRHGYKFRSNSDLCLTGDLRQILPGVIVYGILFDLNLYRHGACRMGISGDYLLHGRVLC